MEATAPRSAFAGLTLTPAEKAAFRRAADADRRSLSDWMRVRLLEVLANGAPPLETAGRPVELRTVPGERGPG